MIDDSGVITVQRQDDIVLEHYFCRVVFVVIKISSFSPILLCSWKYKTFLYCQRNQYLCWKEFLADIFLYNVKNKVVNVCIDNGSHFKKTESKQNMFS